VVLKLHTRKLSRYLLVSVLIFVAGVALVLVVKGRGARPEPEDKIRTRADYRIKQVHLSEEARGGVKWTLDADQAEAFEALGRTTLRKVTITIEEPSRKWTVTGDEGDLFQDTKNVELRGRVVLVSSEGLRLETSKLQWTAKEQRAWTDEPVTIYRAGAVVRGRGLDARVAEQTTEVKGRIRATFGDAASRAPVDGESRRTEGAAGPAERAGAGTPAAPKASR